MPEGDSPFHRDVTELTRQVARLATQMEQITPVLQQQTHTLLDTANRVIKLEAQSENHSAYVKRTDDLQTRTTIMESQSVEREKQQTRFQWAMGILMTLFVAPLIVWLLQSVQTLQIAVGGK